MLHLYVGSVRHFYLLIHIQSFKSRVESFIIVYGKFFFGGGGLSGDN